MPGYRTCLVLLFFFFGILYLTRFTMSLTDVLSAAEISAALRECQAPDSFNPKKFFSTCGITKKTPTQVKEIFKVLDNDHSGFIEEEEVKFLLQRFDAGARLLTSTETREFMTTCDHDGDGKIGADDIWKEMARVLYTATYLSCPNNSRKWFIPKHRVVSIEG